MLTTGELTKFLEWLQIRTNNYFYSAVNQLLNKKSCLTKNIQDPNLI